MKQERFKKVIEWKKKPDLGGILLIIAGLILMHIIVAVENKFCSLYTFMDFLFMWMLNMNLTLGGALILFGVYLLIPIKKKVYWVREK